MSDYILFSKKHFEWFVPLIIEMDLTPKQVDVFIAALVPTNKRYNPAKFRKAVTIYRNQYSGGI